VENATPDFTDGSQYKCRCITNIVWHDLWAMYKSYMKHTWISCLDLGPISKIFHYLYANIPKSEKNPKSKTFLVPNILNKGYLACILKFPFANLRASLT
jgi:hypothetical protein